MRLARVPRAIETERLLIRCPDAGDGPVVYASVMESLDSLRRFPASLPWAMGEPSLAKSEAFCRQGRSSYGRGIEMPMLIFLKSENAHVGNVGLHDFHWKVPKCEIGFWGRTSFAGRGLMTEAVGAVTAFALDHLGMRRIEALPDQGNERSRRLCERVGYDLEGILRHFRAWRDEAPRNACVYSVVK